ncbi:MAG: indole-3-glycerol phosphate synthase TrpC [Anaerolineae bacterium]|nr:indole-3-glycerol phosphate synthase TrpC [Candidatus Roseilinea sp.]MDW8450385.1 indole-3-glycerol phosphate synthase TrpC [Anaerolineae bacterium]
MTQHINRSILETILDHKRNDELPQRKRRTPLSEVRRLAETAGAPARDFATALRRADGLVALIAEIKRASPSKGELAQGEFQPAALARTYVANGASAISVLTDERFFKGSLDHLRQARAVVDVPLLRKDFILDPYQLYEARAAGADAVLLIVAALDDGELRDLFALACELGMTPLVEVHDERETDRALAIGARVIGVNNRDLRTFVTDIETTARCAARLANDCVNADGYTLISESGIFTAGDVARVAAMGAHAVLVGESIITSGDVAAQVRALSQVSRQAAAPGNLPA